MKDFLLFALALAVAIPCSGQRKAIFHDSLGHLTTYELHWAQVVGGRYKSTYNKQTHFRTLLRTTPAEFAAELAKTTARITRTEKVGEAFPAFQVTDLDGQSLTDQSIRGKVAVINFWFVGCAPCEMERPELNELRKKYAANEHVVFLSFAASTPAQLRQFLAEYPFLYSVTPLDRSTINRQFGVTNFPVNLVLDRQGRYTFNSLGSGVGISHILRQHIDQALAQP